MWISTESPRAAPAGILKPGKHTVAIPVVSNDPKSYSSGPDLPLSVE